MTIDSQYRSDAAPDLFAAFGYAVTVFLAVVTAAFLTYYHGAWWLYHNHEFMRTPSEQMTGWEQLPYAAIGLGTPVLIFLLARHLGMRTYRTMLTRLPHGFPSGPGVALGFAGGGILTVAVSALLFAVAFVLFAIYVACACIFGVLLAGLLKD